MLIWKCQVCNANLGEYEPPATEPVCPYHPDNIVEVVDRDDPPTE